MDKAIIMMAVQEETDYELNEKIEEITNLALACEIVAMSVLVQNIKHKSNTYYIGSGKVEELKQHVEANEANLVVFNVSLSPSQIRNLEDILLCDVVDKNMLILEIFSRRAKTPEAKAQVEIARLKYVFPRMVGSYEDLGRQASGFGNRNRGLGETKLELDRRVVGRRIRKLEKDLEKYRKSRQMSRKRRLEGKLPLVALVGYTNAGKSSLMNVFQDKAVYVEDMLFASLETYARKVDFGNNHDFILHDTVGFIKDLPHNLINAFHSTLEEIEDADLLIHVIDRSHPFYDQQKESVEDTLSELEVGDIPLIEVYNKVDLLDEPYSNGENSVFISTKTLEGIDLLKEKITEILWADYKRFTLKIPYDKMNLLDDINRSLNVLRQENFDTHVLLDVACNTKAIERYIQYIG